MASGNLPAFYRYDDTHMYQITWSSTTNVATNTSSVTVKFMINLTSRYGTYSVYTNHCYILFNGTRYNLPSSPWTAPGSGNHILYSKTFTVNHNSDGSGSFTLGGAHKINSTTDRKIWSAQTFALDTIPRASSIGTISGSTIGSAVTVNIDAASTTFSHKYAVRFPNTSTLKLSGDVAAGVKSFSFTPAMSWCNNIPNSTSGTAWVHVDTYSGSTKIGGYVKSFKLNVPPSVVPTINTSTSTVAEGNSAVSAVTSKFVQSLSKFVIKLSASGAYGSTITKREIKANGQTLTTTSNTATATTTAIKNSGNNSVVYTVTDSRGRKASYGRTVSVEAYSTPKITKTTANRASPETTVNIAVAGSWTSLGGDNIAAFSLKRQPMGGSESSVVISPSSGTTGSLNTIYAVSDNDATKSYSYDFKITDRFGYAASAWVTVGTAFQELTIRPGIGVGIGKVHEQGALDVGGDIYADDVLLPGKSVAVKISSFESELGSVAVKINSIQSALNSVASHMAESANKHITESGTNENGSYIKFDDGTMICYAKMTRTGVAANGEATGSWYYPIPFLASSEVVVNITFQTSSGAVANASKLHGGIGGGIYNSACPWGAKNLDTSSRDITAHLTAIGRWK